jgi:hypothetical protein
MSDAAPASNEAAVSSAEAKSVEVVSPEARSAEAAADGVKFAEAGAAAKHGIKTEVSASENVKAEAKAAEAKIEVKSVEVNSDEVRTGALKADAAKTDITKTEVTKAATPKVGTPKADETKAAEKPAEPAQAVAGAPAIAPDAKKDPSRPPGAEKAAATKAEPPKRAGQISVLVSRKDGKLYVRQNFAPLFEVPVTIAPGERMLGTHVFTAEVDKNDPNKLHWSVVSLPVTARNAARNEDDDRASRRRKVAGGAPAEVKAMPAANGPAEALDRITIPPDAMARIAEALTTGGSIIVSDQGVNQGETGEGTDFIVSLR